MICVRLEYLLIFVSIFGVYAADNGVYRVSRQEFSSNAAGFPGASAAYQQQPQPFESKAGVYRVQRQDFTNGYNVPFSGNYQSPYAYRYSKLNHGFGNVSQAFTPLPKLFVPANAQRVENPYLAVGLPNYNRVVPASNFGREFPQTKTQAPTRVTLRPPSSIYEPYDDSVLPAVPNYSQYDSPLPSISDYSKTSFDEDLSSAVEQFEMTEDRKSICKGANCRRANPNDDADAVKPIRKRSVDALFNRGGYYGSHMDAVPFHYRDSNYYRNFHSLSYPQYPIYDHDNDRVYSLLSALRRSQISTTVSSGNDNEESETVSSTESIPTDQSSSNENDREFQSSTESAQADQYISAENNPGLRSSEESALNDQYRSTENNAALESSTESKQTNQYTLTENDNSEFQWSPNSSESDESDVLLPWIRRITPAPESTTTTTAAAAVADAEFDYVHTFDELNIPKDPLLSVEFESLVNKATNTNSNDDLNDGLTIYTTETSTKNNAEFQSSPYVPIASSGSDESKDLFTSMLRITPAPESTTTVSDAELKIQKIVAIIDELNKNLDHRYTELQQSPYVPIDSAESDESEDLLTWMRRTTPAPESTTTVFEVELKSQKVKAIIDKIKKISDQIDEYVKESEHAYDDNDGVTSIGSETDDTTTSSAPDSEETTYERVETSTTSEGNTEVSPNDNFDPLPTIDFNIEEKIWTRHAPEKNIPHDNYDEVTTRKIDPSFEYADPNEDYNIAPIECEFQSEPVPEPTTEPKESSTNSEVTTATELPEEQPPTDQDYFQQLPSEQKFVVLFACKMWSELSERRDMNLAGTETKNFNELCKLLNAIDKEIVDPLSNTNANHANDDDDDENETETKSIEKSDSKEPLVKFFSQILAQSNDNDIKPVDELDKGIEDDSASNASSDDIPVVLILNDMLNVP